MNCLSACLFVCYFNNFGKVGDFSAIFFNEERKIEHSYLTMMYRHSFFIDGDPTSKKIRKSRSEDNESFTLVDHNINSIKDTYPWRDDNDEDLEVGDKSKQIGVNKRIKKIGGSQRIKKIEENQRIKKI